MCLKIRRSQNLQNRWGKVRGEVAAQESGLWRSWLAEDIPGLAYDQRNPIVFEVNSGNVFARCPRRAERQSNRTPVTRATDATTWLVHPHLAARGSMPRRLLTEATGSEPAAVLRSARGLGAPYLPRPPSILRSQPGSGRVPRWVRGPARGSALTGHASSQRTGRRSL